MKTSGSITRNASKPDRRQRVAMAKAILDGDEEIAKVSSGRCSNLILEWMRSDSGGD